MEWRWRYYDINSRKMIEISRKEPDKKRIFIDSAGKWINNYVLDTTWDKYIVSEKYIYVQE